MVYAQSLSQPTVFDLARSGDFRAIGYLINSYLAPQGIQARVIPDRKGCLQVLVEFQQEPIAERIVKYICHVLWKLNSPQVLGVRIAGRFMGQPDILWNQSVRIVTPAARQRSQRRKGSRSSLDFKTLRTLLLMTSVTATLVLGCWVSYYEVIGRDARAMTSSRGGGWRQSNQVVMTSPPVTRPNQVRAALETVPVIQHEAVLNPEDPTVTLMFGGDVNLAGSFAQKVGDNYSWAFSELQEYRDADLAMVNLENPLTRATLARPNRQFNFKADPEAVKVLTEGGIDLVNLANNHIMDYEEAGLVETLETLQQAGIHAIGAGRDIMEARRPKIIEVRGQRIAYFGYYDADFNAAGENRAGTNSRDHERIAADIQAVRDQVDWVIVNYHWGVELSDYPGDWQIDLGRYTIDQGADVVIGHHPQVLQGAEIYKGRPIVYSLGNFIFGGNSRSDYDTAILRVSLKQNRKMKVEFLPVEVRGYQARVMQGESAKATLRHIERISRIFEQPMPYQVILKARSTEPALSDAITTPEVHQESLSPGLSENEGSTTMLDDAPSESSVTADEPTTTWEETSGPSEQLRPFIKTPFITEPFISPPQPEARTSEGSYNNSKSEISFDVSTGSHHKPKDDQSMTNNNRVSAEGSVNAHGGEAIRLPEIGCQRCIGQDVKLSTM
ncbi:CapA family protein [Arthrospira platensis]|jgi:poly-gamma-glutamate synthesis protein (capsule biosynthesis protein)|uniref:Poly-gamma-glutamate biosynthesis protein n=1 Tax=Limnospira platensis NIES-46 TaxID=1236695 RepID=A0A5M3TD85_LIMPL|nr:CapA family protein [Arthrospira platensis]KDR54285.1 poly-gamma-glutamate biosynthesis protein [Arthrospira platensis str. Paraca]MBD2669752.1 CapA family protein [Arthrospira platensis FACHB-439]MBD2710498.1 CapA family protein [Arthrospira platensis FACHB-835]MDF2212069.1 CapA family protein [Arthrospira platensis NCB002]MDT9184174.1 CapA family protein [Limnospira sp. PMC 289.06]MDT9296770.1 CapA family protein [Arthrospira platensis PCC 7345]MDT9312359.1 CapA family protein [Limnospi